LALVVRVVLVHRREGSKSSRLVRTGVWTLRVPFLESRARNQIGRFSATFVTGAQLDVRLLRALETGSIVQVSVERESLPRRIRPIFPREVRRARDRVKSLRRHRVVEEQNISARL